MARASPGAGDVELVMLPREEVVNLLEKERSLIRG